jgi:hypothetical protein
MCSHDDIFSGLYALWSDSERCLAEFKVMSNWTWLDDISDRQRRIRGRSWK